LLVAATVPHNSRKCCIEDGTHTKLLARRGAYYRLWKMQAGGFLPVEANNQNASELQTG
jgi:ATP-binding cassette, subfamily B, bacterial